MPRTFGILVLCAGTALGVLSHASANDATKGAPRGSVINNRPPASRQLTDSNRATTASRPETTEAVVREEAPPEARTELPPRELADETTTETEAVAARTHEHIEATEDEKRRAAAAKQAAQLEEQQMMARVRGLQAMIEREEALLTQRLTQASQIREAGLTKNDQKLLDQAEQIERQALVHYQKRVEQFEKMSLPPAPSRSGQQATPAARTTPPRTNANSGSGR